MKRLKNLVVGILLLVAILLLDKQWRKTMSVKKEGMSGWMWVVVVIAYFLLFLFMSPKAHAQSYTLSYTDTVPRGFGGVTVCDPKTHTPKAIVVDTLSGGTRIVVTAHEWMHIYRMSLLKPDCLAWNNVYKDSALYRLDEEIWAYAMSLKVGVALLGWSQDKALANYTEAIMKYRGFWEDRQLLSPEEVSNLLRVRQDSLPPIPNEIFVLVRLQRPP